MTYSQKPCTDFKFHELKMQAGLAVTGRLVYHHVTDIKQVIRKAPH